MHQVSKPRSANRSITDECGRPGTCRSKVGCEAIDDPCTKRMVPRVALPACLRQRNSLTSPVRVQCSVPFIGPVIYPFYARIRRPRRGFGESGQRDARHVSEAADAPSAREDGQTRYSRKGSRQLEDDGTDDTGL